MSTWENELQVHTHCDVVFGCKLRSAGTWKGACPVADAEHRVRTTTLLTVAIRTDDVMSSARAEHEKIVAAWKEFVTSRLPLNPTLSGVSWQVTGETTTIPILLD